MNMTSIVKYVLVLCVLFVAGYTNAQITINTNFSVLSNQPIDSRDTLTTLADTSGVTWTFPGLLSYVVDIDEFWYYTGTQWRKLFDGTTIPSTVPDSLIVYAPAHGLSDTIALYGYVPVKADFTRANSTSIDSVFIAYAIDAPDTDSLTLIFSGVLTYGSWHGKELNTQYYLQDDGSDDTTPGTVSVPTAIASDSLILFLREVGSDIAGQLRRVAMPSPLITAFGGNPASPTDAVVQAAIEGTYLPAGLAQPGTIFTLSYATQSYNPTYQQTAPNTNPLTPSYAWLWDGALATRIVNIPTSVNLQDVAYGVLGTLVLLPIDSLMAASVPTDTEVALWLDTNYTANNLRLANGSLLYFLGDSTRQNPEYIWQVIDDISYDAGDTDWEKILKRIKSPVVAADGNGLFDAANDGDTIRATSAYFTELELSHTNGDGQFTLSDGQLNVLLESQEEIAGTRTMLLLDTLGISKLGLQTPSKESWVGFDYTIGDSLGLLVMIDSIYPDSGQILIAGADSLFRFGSLPSGADGNGIFDAANDGDTTAVSSVVLGQDFAVDMDGNDWLFDGLVEDDTTSRIMTLRGDGSLAYRWLDSLLNGYTTGTGTSGTLPIWTGAGTLGNSSLTEAGGVLSSSLTGAFLLPKGTTAQQPVGVAGQLRHNTTTGELEWYSGSAFENLSYYFTKSGANVSLKDYNGTFTIPLSNSNEFRFNGSTAQFYNGTSSTLYLSLGYNGASNNDTGILRLGGRTTSTGGSVEFYQTGTLRAYMGYDNAISGFDNSLALIVGNSSSIANSEIGLGFARNSTNGVTQRFFSVSSQDVDFVIDITRTSGTTVQEAHNLLLISGAPKAGETNYNGGELSLRSGTSTGSGSSWVSFYTATPGGSGTTDRSPSEKVRITGTGTLAVGTTSPDASALVQVESTTQGFLPPRMTTAQRDAIGSPAAGLVIFNTTTTKLECYDGATWQAAW